MAEIDQYEIEQLADAQVPPEWMVGDDEPRKRVHVIHWAKDANEPFIPNWIVEGVVSEGSLAIVFGEPGCGKTYAMIDMAVSVASGEKSWLGLPIKQTTVFIADEESGHKRLGGRVYSVKRGHDSPKDIPLGWNALEGYNLRDSNSVMELKDTIIESGAGLVIVDTLSDVCAGADENSVKEMMPALIALRRLAEGLEIGIVVIHHSNKSGGYRGTSALKGKCDYMIKVESEDSKINFTGEKSRDSDSIKISARVFLSGGMYNLSLIDREDIDKTKKSSSGEQYVMRYLKEHGRSFKTVICNSADTCAAGTARNAIYTLVAKGKIRRVDEGESGDVAEYDLV